MLAVSIQRFCIAYQELLNRAVNEDWQAKPSGVGVERLNRLQHIANIYQLVNFEGYENPPKVRTCDVLQNYSLMAFDFNDRDWHCDHHTEAELFGDENADKPAPRKYPEATHDDPKSRLVIVPPVQPKQPGQEVINHFKEAIAYIKAIAIQTGIGHRHIQNLGEIYQGRHGFTESSSVSSSSNQTDLGARGVVAAGPIKGSSWVGWGAGRFYGPGHSMERSLREMVVHLTDAVKELQAQLQDTQSNNSVASSQSSASNFVNS